MPHPRKEKHDAGSRRLRRPPHGRGPCWPAIAPCHFAPRRRAPARRAPRQRAPGRPGPHECRSCQGVGSDGDRGAPLRRSGADWPRGFDDRFERANQALPAERLRGLTGSSERCQRPPRPTGPACHLRRPAPPDHRRPLLRATPDRGRGRSNPRPLLLIRDAGGRLGYRALRPAAARHRRLDLRHLAARRPGRCRRLLDHRGLPRDIVLDIATDQGSKDDGDRLRRTPLPDLGRQLSPVAPRGSRDRGRGQREVPGLNDRYLLRPRASARPEPRHVGQR